MSFERMVLAARVLLGVFYLLSGLNWFFGYLPLPSMHMPLDVHLKHQVVLEMIRTGWMFQFAKIAEIAVGMALLGNRLVPAMLAVSAPVAFITFMLDAMILDDLVEWFTGAATTSHLLGEIYDMVVGGLCVLLLHLWLMLCYFESYRPMLVWKKKPQEFAAVGRRQDAVSRGGVLRITFYSIGFLALALQAWNLYLFLGLIGN